MTDDLFLTAEETASRLGVSIPSVYAYVSRGLIRSQRLPGSKKRLYWRADVEKMRAGGAPADEALPECLVESTRITLLTRHGHYYRGRPALELARSATLEQVAALLWEAEESVVFGHRPPVVPQSATPLAEHETALQRILATLFAMEESNPRAYDLTRDGYCRSGADVLRCVAAASLGVTDLGTAPLHEAVIAALGADPRLGEVLRHYFVLAADHELDPTTYAVRAAANTGVTPYAAVAAGFLTASGRRLVFGRSPSVGRFYDELDVAADPRSPILRRVRLGEPLPGFGSRAYDEGDPRALSLLRELRAVCGGDPDFDRLERAIEAAHETAGASPGFVLPALFLERRLGLLADQSTLLRVARVVGWIAHAMEQFYDRELVRPHADYTGVLPEPTPRA